MGRWRGWAHELPREQVAEGRVVGPPLDAAAAAAHRRLLRRRRSGSGGRTPPRGEVVRTEAGVPRVQLEELREEEHPAPAPAPPPRTPTLARTNSSLAASSCWRRRSGRYSRTTGSEWLPDDSAKCTSGSGLSTANPCRSSFSLDFHFGYRSSLSHCTNHMQFKMANFTNHSSRSNCD